MRRLVQLSGWPCCCSWRAAPLNNEAPQTRDEAMAIRRPASIASVPRSAEHFVIDRPIGVVVASVAEFRNKCLQAFMPLFLRIIFPVLCLLLAVPAAARAEEAITEKNWLNHPAVAEVRLLYQEINEARAAGRLVRKERKFDTSSCEPYEDDSRTLYLDRNKKPRIYRYEGGSDDSAVKREMFYDDKGKLRFAFIVAGAYNGTRLEHRVYFSRTGKKIWESQKLLEGPGYTFPDVWPDDELIQNPLQAFNSMSPCKEE